MSHFTNMKTSFRNLFYLTKTLNQLNIQYNQKQIVNDKLNSSHINLVIPQSNSYNSEFCWNGQEYDLVVDTSFWEQDYPVQSFIDKIAQKYAAEVVVGESQKIGFKPVTYKQNADGSNTIILERWGN